MEKLSLLWLWQRVKEPVDLRWVLCVACSSTPSPLGFGTPDFRWAHCQNKKLLFPASLAGKVLKTRFRSLRPKGKYHVGLEEFSLKGLGLLYFPPFPSRMDVAAATGVHGMETTCRGQRMQRRKTAVGSLRHMETSCQLRTDGFHCASYYTPIHFYFL